MVSIINGWSTSEDSPYGLTKGIFSTSSKIDRQIITDALALPLSRLRWNMDGLLIEPSSGSFTWTVLDDAIYQANKAGLRVTFPIRELSPKAGGTAWSTVSTPCQSGGNYYFGTVTNYTNFAVAVCKRYSGDGNPANAIAPDGSKRPLWIDCLEVMNEDCDVHGTGTTVAASPCRTGLRYIQYARSMVAAMRKPVSQGGGGWTRRIGMMGWCWMNKAHITEVLNDLYNPPTDATYNPSGDSSPVVPLFDYVNFHNYANPPIGFHINPYTIDQQLIDMRTIMNANGDSARPIWMTEFGATGPVGNATEAAQSAYYAARIDGTGAGALAAARDNGAQHIDLYTMDGLGAQSGTNALYYGDPKNIAANLRAGGHKRFLAFSTISKFIAANPTFPFGFTGGGGPPPPPPSTSSLLWFAYFNPTDPSGTNAYWIEARGTAPLTPRVFVFNVNNGPGSGPDSNFTTAISQAHALGQWVIGYVNTSNFTSVTPLAQVEGDIDKWYSWYNIDGIMLDTVLPTSGNFTYYQTIYSYIKSKGTGPCFVVQNPAAFPPENYLSTPIVDTVVTYEEEYTNFVNNYAGSVPSWVPNYNPSRFAVIVGTVPDQASIQQVVSIGKTAGIGRFYISSSPSQSAYSSMPTQPYFTNVVTAVYGGVGGSGGGPTPGPYTGTLTGAFAPLASAAVNLTTEAGTGDWAHWGVTGTTFDHKATGGTQISNFSTLGNGVAAQNPSALNSFTWTGGTPNATETATQTGVKILPPAIPT